MTNKDFAEVNAGKYFRFNGEQVRVVGYDGQGHNCVIVTRPRGWQRLDSRDRIIIKTKARNFWYVDFMHLGEVI